MTSSSPALPLCTLDHLVPRGVTIHALACSSGLHDVLESVVWRSGTLPRLHTPFR
ncbi:MAG: hypothetical protein FJ096_14970 [Deltaproteobacteria bacterium]|nr:hypothetical protein [Deltaproteobacteria bacterium]